MIRGSLKAGSAYDKVFRYACREFPAGAHFNKLTETEIPAAAAALSTRRERRMGPPGAPPRLDARDSSSSRVITGLAAVFYNPADPGTEYDLFGDGSVLERIMPNAFDRALREKDDVVLLYNHDDSLLLGRTTSRTVELSVGVKGLEYRGTLPSTATGDEVLELLRRRDLSGSSFSFRVESEAFYRSGDAIIREIRSVRLFDVSCVTHPAYPSTVADVASGFLSPRADAADDDEAALAERARRTRQLDLASKE